MIKLNQLFDPLLSQQYAALFNSSELPVLDARQLFYLLNQPVKKQTLLYSAYQFIQLQMQQLEDEDIALCDWDELNVSDLKDTLILPLDESLQTPDYFADCVRQSAAIHLTEPCWLEAISQVSSGQHTCAVQIMSVYLKIAASEQGHTDFRKAYRSLLLLTSGEIPSLYTAGYSQQLTICNEVFDMAALQLAFAQFPRVLFPEILGFTLAYCQTSSLIEICFTQFRSETTLLNHKKQLPAIQQCINDYLALFPQQQKNIVLRIKNGFALYRSKIRLCRDQFNITYANRLPPELAIVEIFQQKIKAALGHHQRVMLKGINLDQWFAGFPENSEQFMEALKQSDFIDQKNPENSRLLKLFDYKGPMFGVLNNAELEVMKQWLSNGTSQSFVKKPIAVNYLNFQHTSVTAMLSQTEINASRQKYAKLSHRAFYYYLINADVYADCLPVAKSKVEMCLRVCGFFNRAPFKHYSHQQLDDYIEQRYQAEMAKYQPLQGQPKISKTAYQWGLEQVAPMILIDGCWLQNSLSLQNSYPEISSILYAIYGDEMGNGQREQNHPYIFQKLLESLSIKLPAVYTKAFVEHKGFINSAFDLPVYMLSLSHHTVEFLPELLGLNMAIELSGLGHSYMNLVDEWKYWQIDPTIAEIHISIDNYASGHTYLAKKAVKLYMDTVMQTSQDPIIIDRQWRRIYNGFASLTFVGGRFKLSLPVFYMLNKFCQQFNSEK